MRRLRTLTVLGLGLVALLLLLPAGAGAATVRNGPPPKLKALRGKPVAIMFFHPFCSDCQREAPRVARYARTHPRVRVIAVAHFAARRADVVRFTRARFGRAPVTVYYDPTGAAYRRFGVPHYPDFRFFTKRGRATGPFRGFPR